MKTAFLIHGAYGNSNNHWFPWLKNELTKLDYNVIASTFPTPEGQNLNTWLKIFAQYQPQINSDTIMIGHSLGVPFILNILENLKQPIKAAFLVAGFVGILNNDQFDPINKTFAERNFNWKKIKSNCQNFTIFHSDNDPYVSLNKAKELSTFLNTPIKLIPNAGHFNTDAGYFEFPELLESIKI